MANEVAEARELRDLGLHLLSARAESGLSQAELAKQCSLAQAHISYFELGLRRPTLDQLLKIARALDVPVQRLLTGSDRPGTALRDLAIELHHLGVADLWVKDATVPGAFRRPEEIIALAVSGREPEPRVIEAIPAVLAWNDYDPVILRAHARATRTLFRLAWLAEVALAIDRQGGFPGNCRVELLARFLKSGTLPTERTAWDGLGRPMAESPKSPLWKRWRINYDADLSQFRSRATTLDGLCKPRGARSGLEQARIALRAKARRAERSAGIPPAQEQARDASRAKATGKEAAKRRARRKGRDDGQ